MCAMSNSKDFSVVLTFENSSSMGFRSGEYGGRKSTSAISLMLLPLLDGGWSNCPIQPQSED